MSEQHLIQVTGDQSVTFTIWDVDTQARIITTLIGDAAPLVSHLPGLLADAAAQIIHDQQP